MANKTINKFEPNFKIQMNGKKGSNNLWLRNVNIYAPDEMRAFEWADKQAQVLNVSKLKTYVTPIFTPLPNAIPTNLVD